MRSKTLLLLACVSLALLINLNCGGGGGGSESAEEACGSCHGVPPVTGSHPVHYAAALTNATYGGTEGTEALLPSGTAYAFGCGSCHPLDIASHGNGVQNAGGGNAEVTFSPAGAPPGSLRALNAAGAVYAPGGTVYVDTDGLSYTEGSCDGVYCHSYLEVSVPGEVPVPGVDFVFTGYPISYPAYTVDFIRAYATPKWGDSLSCDACHGFPPRTYGPAVPAGVGDSHSWIDSYGYENLHGYGHGFAPIPCSTCHYQTVQAPGTRSYTLSGVSVYDPVPVSSYGSHVNGRAEVLFSEVPVTLNPALPAYDMSAAGYDTTAGTCSNVPCHLKQTEVTWGSPYRPVAVLYECNVCHQF